MWREKYNLNDFEENIEGYLCDLWLKKKYPGIPVHKKEVDKINYESKNISHTTGRNDRGIVSSVYFLKKKIYKILRKRKTT